MASGTIIGMCKICKELIWEDEEYTEDTHIICKEKIRQIEKIIDFKDKKLLEILRGYIKDKLEGENN